MRQRYYNPEIKRFINQDILTGSIVSPKSLNRYAYVQGNPVSFVDPFGLSPSNAQGGYNFWLGMTHILFGVLGFVPGPVGVAANLADAVVYGFVDHDYFGCMLSVLGAVTCGFAGAAKTSIIAKTVCTVCSTTSLSLITANSGYKIGNDLSDIMDCYVFHETTPEELNLGNKLVDIGINTFTIGVSALSAHLTQVEYRKALNSTPSNGNISDKAKWINTEALDDASSKIDDVMIEARNSGMVMEGGSGTKDIYRAVGVDEYYDIMQTGKFRGVEGSFAAKEFGNDFSETLDFANRSINKDKVAIIKVTIPESTYNQLHHMNLDAPIFKSGTPVVEPEMLDFFNNSILNIEHIY